MTHMKRDQKFIVSLWYEHKVKNVFEVFLFVDIRIRYYMESRKHLFMVDPNDYALHLWEN